MYVKETQLVTLCLPKEAHLLRDFEEDKDWHEVSISTVGATFEKVLKEGTINVKEANHVDKA
jgi:hypothetical protein